MSSYDYANRRKTGVLIIGAGISGLAAAKTMLDEDYQDFIILEAQNEPGGRIQTHHLTDSTFLEIGAQWIHENNNNLYKLADKYNLISSENSQEGAGIFIRDDGFIIDNGLVTQVDFEIGRILKDSEEFFYSENNAYPKSIGDYLEERFEDYLQSCIEDTDEVKNLKRQIFNWHIRFQVIDNSCITLKKVSAKMWGSYFLSSDHGQAHINLKNGYGSIVKVICNMLPKNALQLKTVVTSIKWNNNLNTVLVDCKNGQKYEADFVIITASLGYLKENHTKLFNPELPLKMRESIEKMGFWGINKIFLEFDVKWWNVPGFQFIWNEINCNIDSKHWSKDISGFDELRCDANILVGWVGGLGAKIVEHISEEEIGNCCVNLLQKFTGLNIPNPKRVIRSKWLSNPYICGAYSYLSTDCDSSNLSPDHLAKPLVNGNNIPVMALAGEACHNTQFSTTHGAYESGQNQANIALQKVLLNNNCSKGLTAENMTIL